MAYDPSYVRGKSAIVGIAEAVSSTGELGISERDIEVKMIMAALDDAGLKLSDVDALFCTGMILPPSPWACVKIMSSINTKALPPMVKWEIPFAPYAKLRWLASNTMMLIC